VTKCAPRFRFINTASDGCNPKLNPRQRRTIWDKCTYRACSGTSWRSCIVSYNVGELLLCRQLPVLRKTSWRQYGGFGYALCRRPNWRTNMLTSVHLLVKRVGWFTNGSDRSSCSNE